MKKLSLLFIILVLSVSCAKKKPPERAKSKPETRPVPSATIEEEDFETPERQASNALIDEGMVFLKRGLYGRSSDLFQEAVTVDPTNGSGYFYLCQAKLRGAEYGEAEGLLEKAESLLGHKPDWADRLKDLRAELEQRRPNEIR